MVQDILTMVDQ